MCRKEAPEPPPLRREVEAERREHERIEARRADLATTRDLLSRVTSRALGARARAVEVIEDAHAPSVVSALLADTTGLLRNYVLTVAEGPALDAATMQPTPFLRP